MSAPQSQVQTPGRVPLRQSLRRRIADARLIEPRAEARSAAFTLQRAMQIALGLMWLADGLLQFQPYFFNKTFATGVIDPNAAGQPAFVAHAITYIADSIVAPHVILFNGFAAVLEVAIGLGLLYGRTVRLALLVSIPWALNIWFTGEGFGGLLTGNASPLASAPGQAVLYALIALLVWPRVGASSDGPPENAASLGLLGSRTVRVVWAVLWFGLAALWLIPANLTAGAFHDAIAAAPTGAAWLTSLENGAARVVAGDGVGLSIAFAVVYVAIGTAVAVDWHPKPFLVAAIVISLALWLFTEGLGGVFTGQATDIDAGPVFILLAALLWPLRARTDAGGRA